jgi:heme-degrading monooxygenase HmoA
MIARIWSGRTSREKYDEYTALLSKIAKPNYAAVKGNLGFYFLRRADANIGHFTLITFWDSVESIKAFAGEDYERAKYYPEDDEFLLDFEERVQHFEVFDHNDFSSFLKT